MAVDLVVWWRSLDGNLVDNEVIMKTILILLLTTFLWADYIHVYKTDGAEIKSFDSPTQEQLDSMTSRGYAYVIKPTEQDAVTQQQIDDAIAQALANKSDSQKDASKWERAIIKTIAFYEGVPIAEVRQRVESNLP
jgi:hypothetical protein